MSNFAERVKKIQKNKDKLSDIAYMSIKTAIVNFEFDPGSYLSENMLAESLEMSRTPVREAISMLSQENLLEVKKGGIYVSEISVNDLKQIYDARKALECEAMRTAGENITTEEINYFRSKGEKCLEIFLARNKIDWETISTYDRELHNMIIQRSNNLYIQKLARVIDAQVGRYQYLAAIAHDNIEDTIHQHLEIIDLIERNDEQLINKLRLHIDQAANNIVELMINKQNHLFELLKAKSKES